MIHEYRTCYRIVRLKDAVCSKCGAEYLVGIGVKDRICPICNRRGDDSLAVFPVVSVTGEGSREGTT